MVDQVSTCLSIGSTGGRSRWWQEWSRRSASRSRSAIVHRPGKDRRRSCRPRRATTSSVPPRARWPGSWRGRSAARPARWLGRSRSLRLEPAEKSEIAADLGLAGGGRWPAGVKVAPLATPGVAADRPRAAKGRAAHAPCAREGAPPTALVTIDQVHVGVGRARTSSWPSRSGWWFAPISSPRRRSPRRGSRRPSGRRPASRC